MTRVDRTHRRSRGGRLLPLVSWCVLLVAGGALLVSVVVPRLAGATPYTVLTSSMEPTYPPGTLVVVRPVPVEDIGVGDVITYQLESGRPAVVTHRVVAVGASIGSGKRTFTTRGDANGADDPAPVRPVQVRGVLWYHVPFLGRVSTALDGDQRQLATYGVAAGLLGYAALMFASSISTRRRRGETTRTTRHENQKEEVSR
jgi:signal peptidase